MPADRSYTAHHTFKDLPESEYREYLAMGVQDFRYLDDDFTSCLITLDRLVIECSTREDGSIEVTFKPED